MSKYLAIKNWDKYQSAKKGATWIKDYVNQTDDPELASLSFFQRGVLQELRRLRARTGKNLRNDPVYLSRAISAPPEERHCIGRTIAVLVSRGILILTDQQDNVLEESRKEEKRVEESRSEPAKPHAPIPENSDIKIEEIAKAHPKHRKPIETEREIVAQLDRLGDQMGVASAMKYLLERTLRYAQAYKRWPKKQQQYSPESPRWFHAACFDEDPQQWEVIENSEVKGKMQEQFDAIDRAQF